MTSDHPSNAFLRSAILGFIILEMNESLHEPNLRISQCIAEHQPALHSQNLQFSVKNYFLKSLQSKQLTILEGLAMSKAHLPTPQPPESAEIILRLVPPLAIHGTLTSVIIPREPQFPNL